jgi:predicted nucleic acid-binding protein
LALRRNTQENGIETVNDLQGLITDGRVILLGVVRQEVLSGIRYQEQFDRLRNYLRAFPNLELTAEDYELAAEYFNICRRQGIQGANTDFLICAVAHRHNCSIFTTDKDFENFQPHIPVVLH